MLRFLGSLAMFFGPMLVLTYSWPGMKKRTRLIMGGIVYGCYLIGTLAFQPTLQNLTFTKYLLEAESWANQQTLRLLVGILLIVHLLLFSRKIDLTQIAWVRWVTPFRAAALLTLVLSLGMVLLSTVFQDQAKTMNSFSAVALYFWLVFQCFMVYLPYYILYHVHHHYLFSDLWLRSTVHYLLGSIGLVLSFAIIHAWLVLWLPLVNVYFLHPAGLTPSVISDISIGLAISVFTLSFPFILTLEWFRKERAITALAAEKSTAELALLKEQINPHFFFNTLNNLYAMSLTAEADTPKTILKLSQLMRYVIYKGKKQTVTLREEVNYLQDYLDLQTIRLHKPLDLRFDAELENEGLPIPPLLFIVLVENAFKHGVEPAEDNSFLHLSLSSTSSDLTFRCRNSIPPLEENRPAPGIGIDNLRRRLALYFPDRHKIEIERKTNDFLVVLKLEL
jgi:sensor histidine kinase YesM